MSEKNKNDRQQRRRKEKQRRTRQRRDSLQRKQAKKPDEAGLRLVKEPPGGSDSLPPPPRMSMERTMREVQQMLASQEFASEEEMHAFMAEFNVSGGSPATLIGLSDYLARSGQGIS